MVQHHPWHADSAFAAYLTHALENLRQQLEADIAVSARFNQGPNSPSHAYHVGLSPDIARSLDLANWPQDPGSALEYLAGPAPTNKALRPIEIVGASAVARSALFRRLEHVRPVGDALALSLELDTTARQAFVFLRWFNRSRFSQNDERGLSDTIDILRQRLTLASNDSIQPPTGPVSGAVLNQHLQPATVSDRLSTTEQKILKYLKQALTEKQIAEEINRSPHTVHVHVKSIYLKLGVSSRRELLARLNSLK
ncbi:MAG: helix-turn-helix transcriptional regulator [Phycisphaeraceae bacterium]